MNTILYYYTEDKRERKKNKVPNVFHLCHSELDSLKSKFSLKKDRCYIQNDMSLWRNLTTHDHCFRCVFVCLYWDSFARRNLIRCDDAGVKAMAYLCYFFPSSFFPLRRLLWQWQFIYLFFFFFPQCNSCC